MVYLHSAYDGKGRCVYDVTHLIVSTANYMKRDNRNLHIIQKDWRYYFYYRGDIESTKKLLKLGADINITDFDGWSPLFMAIYARHLDSVKLLIDSGANVNLHDKEDRSPADLAVEILDSKLICMLMECEDIIVRGEIVKWAIEDGLSLYVISKMLARSIRSGDTNMSWHMTGIQNIYRKNLHTRNRKLFIMLVIAFPGLRNEPSDFYNRTCYEVLEDYFIKEGVPRRQAKNILGILNHETFPTLFDILFFYCSVWLVE